MQEQKLTSLSVPVLLDGQLWQPVIGSGLVQSIRSLSAQQGCWEAERPGIVKTQLQPLALGAQPRPLLCLKELR